MKVEPEPSNIVSNQIADTERTAGMADALEFVWWQQLGLDKDEIDPDQSDGEAS